MLRKYAAVIASVAMLSSTTMAFAADDTHQASQPQQGALAPGHAAGVEQARGLTTNVLLIGLGLGLVAGGVAIALSSSHHSHSTTTTH